ncbi:MAG TPA: NADH-quinone oxidoreductase subunit L [Anaerolineales bacterium]
MNLIPFVWLIPLPPLIAFTLIVLFTHRSKAISQALSIGMMGASFVLAQVVFWNAVLGSQLAEEPLASSVAWLPFRDPGSWLRVGVLVDPLTAVILFMVTLTCLLIFTYSTEYMRGDPRFSRFFAYLSLFATGMLGLVVADNLLALFVFWEVMGLCSYLLIGFWFEKPAAYRAAMKAFMTTRVGDVLLLLGIVYLYTQTGRLDFQTLLRPDTLASLGAAPSVIKGLSVAGLAGLLLFAGTVGKSAQFPLHVWLPDAMEGPTPVSAMIHAATMVSAGVYLAIRMFPLLSAGGTPMPAMALIGGFSAFFAATIALAQNDIKRVMAYSTISQLAYMVAALGIGAYVAAIFHLLMHAFFKALLFLSAGSVIHGVEHGAHQTGQHLDAQDMLNMGGLRKRMPRTFLAFMAGGLALTGIPPFAGFWSKDAILGSAYEAFRESGVLSWGFYAWLLLSASAFLTALYVGRQMFLTFGGRARTPAAGNASDTGWAIGLPLLVLAAFATLSGFIGLPEEFPLLGPLFGRNWLLGFVGKQYGEAPLSFGVMGLSVGLALAGWAAAWRLYGRRPLAAGEPDPLAAALGPIHTVLKNKYYVDELYRAVILRPISAAAVWVYHAIDLAAIDGLLHAAGRASLRWGELNRLFDRHIINGSANLIGKTTGRFGRELRMIQTGLIQDYLFLALVSLIVFSLAVYFFVR